MPGGIPYIIGNEAAERFSFYGMKSILFIFMTKYLMDSNGQLDVMTKEQANFYFHLFSASAYFFPLIGAIVADAFLGKYRTIILLSIVYCFGHLVLSIDDTRFGLAIGLSLIAVGTGAIKPCVSAHVGDQFGQRNQHLLSRIFGWFYFSINLGAFVSTMLTPILLDKVGPWLAFGVPGVLMLLATWVFWLGRHKFVHIPAGGLGFLRESFSGAGRRALLNLLPVYVFVAMFWALFDQTGSSWVSQAENMDRYWLGITWLPSQIQAVNPIMILVYIPLFSYVIYPLIERVFPLTPLRKISLGLFVTIGAFAVIGWIQTRIDVGETPSIGWQIVAYGVITAAEVMISITCLEFSYTQAPKPMKSFIMSLYLLSVSAGNLFAAGVNDFIQNEDKTSKLPGASYYWFFTACIAVAAVGFIPVAKRYRGQTYIQE
jgi:POT family proton-dependent oligopeptide transporter